MKTVVTMMNNNNYEIILVRNKYEAIAIILEKGYSFSDEIFFAAMERVSKRPDLLAQRNHA